MGNTEKFGQDAVLRARVLLLGSEPPSWWEEVTAYRVLATVSPAAYLPRLVAALLECRTRSVLATDAKAVLALLAEAVEAARRIAPDEPGGLRLLSEALQAHEEAARHLDGDTPPIVTGA
ncbi:hypothetical protein AB0G79_18940 [Streptomyces sp. NPDC020807]|uniref:hypothetical protein n=1 Tax=Streptomyces sp. NPDC020807 TaxID=3155119 RepID=UPI0033ECF49F